MSDGLRYAVLLSAGVVISLASDQLPLCQEPVPAQDPNAYLDDWTSLMQTFSVARGRRSDATHPLTGAVSSELVVNDAIQNSQNSLAQKDTEEEGVQPVLTEQAQVKPQPAASQSSVMMPQLRVSQLSVNGEKQKQNATLHHDVFSAFDFLAWMKKDVKSMTDSPVAHYIGMGLTLAGAVAVFLLVVFSMRGQLQRWLPTPAPLSANELRAKKESGKVYATLLSMAALGATVTDQYLPSLDAMQADFHTTSQNMSLSLQVSWLVTGVSALLVAGLADKFGRKPMMIFCMSCSAIGSLSCAMAPSLGWFIGARVFQGLAGGGEIVIMMTIRDMIDNADERLAYTSAFFMVWILMPAVAPAIGGLIAHFVGWRAPFLVAAEWALCNLYFVAEKLQDTLPADKGVHRTWTDYRVEVKRVLCDWQVMALGIVQGLSMMTFFSVETIFSQVLGDVFHQNQLQIAWQLAVVVVAMLLPAIMAEALSEHVGAANVLNGSATCLLVPIIGAFIVGRWAAQTWQAVCGIVLVTMIPVMPCGLGANTLYFQTVKEESGAASGIIKCIVMTITSFGTLGSSFLIQGSTHRAQALLLWIFMTTSALFGLAWLGFGCCPPKWTFSSKAAPEKEFQTRQSPRDLRVNAADIQVGLRPQEF